MAKTTAEKIENIKIEIEQLENQRKRLLQQQKEQERKDRTKRLCKRAGLLESFLPDTIALTDEQFKVFLEKTLLNEYSKKILHGLKGQAAETTAPEPAATAQGGSNSASANDSSGIRVSG